MDSLTASIAQMDVPLITLASTLLDNEIVLVAVTFLFVLLSERRRGKLAKIALAVVLAVLLGTVVKSIIKAERPCIGLQSKIECPDSYSFPSGHTIVAFTVMLAFLNKPTFVIYFMYAVFVAFTRIYLGVHTFEDVAGSVAFAPLAYYLADGAWRKIWGKKYAFRHQSGQ